MGAVWLRASVQGSHRIGPNSVSPSTIVVKVPTPLTFTSRITDTSVRKENVILLQTDASGNPGDVLGKLRDDGKDGDSIRGDGVYTFRLVLTGAKLGSLTFRIAARFKDDAKGKGRDDDDDDDWDGDLARLKGSGAGNDRQSRLAPLIRKLNRYTLSEILTVQVIAPNGPPVARIAPVGSIFVSRPVPLDGRASSDPDGSALTYSWSLVARPSGSNATVSNTDNSQASFVPDRPGTYQAKLLVSDGLLSGQAVITLTTTNTSPVANTGADQTIHPGNTVALNGSASSDVDGDALVYRWTLVSRPVGSAATLSDPSVVRPSLFVDEPGAYFIDLVVTDTSGAASVPARTTISTVNSAPLADAGPAQTVRLGTLVTLDGTRSSDPDGDGLAYGWRFVAVPNGSAASLTGVAGPTPSFTADRRGDFIVTLTVTDVFGASSTATVTITTSNTAPVAHAGPDVTSAVGTDVTLDGSGSTDVDGDAITYHWSLTTVPSGSLAALSGSSAISPTFTIDRPGTYVAQLIVNDATSASAPDTMVVSTINSRPIASAGADQTGFVGATVAFDGSGSRDVDGDPLGYSWALTSAPIGSVAMLFGSLSPVASLTLDKSGTYVVQLVVDDGSLASVPATLVVTTSNSAPVADAGADQEGQVDLPTTLDGGASFDVDGDALRYAWSLLARPAGSQAVLVDADSVSPGLSPDVAGTYVAQLIVHDSARASEPDTVTLLIAGRPNFAPTASAGVDQVAPVGSLITLDGTGSSDPENDVLEVQWTFSSKPAGSVATLSGDTTASPVFTADVPGVFIVQLVVHDGQLASAPDSVAITSTNDAPVADAGPAQIVPVGSAVALDGSGSSDPEGQPITVAWSLQTRPAGSAAILQDINSMSPSFTADVPGRYICQLIVTDPFGGTSVPASVTIDTLNRAPLAGSDTVLTEQDTAVVLAVLANDTDPDGDAITLASFGQGAYGLVTLIAPGVLQYTPTAGFVGSDGWTYVIDDGREGSALGNVTVTVRRANRAPIAVDDSARGEPGVAIGISILANDIDDDGDSLSVTGVTQGQAGGVVALADGTIQYTQNPGVGAADSFTYTISDGRGGIAAANVAILPPLLTTFESSPAGGEGDVAVTRETVIRLSRPLEQSLEIPAGAITAEFGGAVLPARLHVSPDRATFTLFYYQTLPASARIRVHVLGDILTDRLGRLVDADGDGQPGGTGTFDFDTLTLTTLPQTAVAGRVFASELGDGGVNTPLVGVVVSVDGAETTLRTTTDAMGNFTLAPAPVGAFFVHIDGRTATNAAPLGGYYPTVGKKWEAIAGITSDVGNVYLPLIPPDTLQPVSLTETTVITFPASVLAAHPELDGVSISVPADSLYWDNGARGGKVGIAPVPPDRIPSPLPPGLAFPLVITVQTDGAMNFDQPVPVCFPNLPSPSETEPLIPGQKSALWSFNHDTGDWEIVGPMTVTSDGHLICTDLGVGIRAPGWHGAQPGTSVEYLFNWLFQVGDDKSGDPGSWPPPQPPMYDSATGAYSTAGNQVVGANEFEAAENREAIDQAVSDSPVGLAVVGSAGGSLLGASILSGFAADKDFDHVAIAYRDPVTGAIRIAELLVGPTSHDPILNSLLGSSHPGSRSLNEFAGTTDRVTAVPLHLSPGVGSQFLSQMIALTAAGATYSFTATTGNTCASVIAQNIRNTGVSTEFGLPSLFGWNVVTPKQVVDLAKGLGKEARALISPASVVPTNPAVAITPPVAVDRLVRIIVPKYFYRIDFSRDEGTITTLTGTTGASNRISAILPPQADGYILSYESTTQSLVGMLFHTGPSGTRTQNVIKLLSANAVDDTDDDADGIPNLAEQIIGTSPNVADTDFDGVSDGAEVQQGTNPLDLVPATTGIVTTVDTPGTALDVAARNDVAVVADSDRGISVMNVAAGLNPVVVAQVDTPGNAQGVAFEDTLVAIADGPGGLVIVDIADPPAARIVHQLDATELGGDAIAVAVAGGTAFVGSSGTGGTVLAVDLETGAELARISIPGGVHDLSFARDELYVLTGSELRIYRTDSGFQLLGAIAVAGSPSPLEVGRKLFVGGNRAYVGFFTGYSVVDVSNPAAPVLVGSPTTTQAAVHDLSANGSGLLLASTSFSGPSSLAVSLYDASNPADVTRFLTSFDTPGDNRGLSLYHGVAYVADSQAGLQVINYRAFDTNRSAPTIVLESNFSFSGTTRNAEEGKVMRLTALVTDDVQVRNVEFFLDGLSVARDGNFPFEHRFVTPLLISQASFTVRACAFDTGGNQACTADLTIALAADATPPQVTQVIPANGARAAENTVSDLSATFSEPIDAMLLTGSTFQVFSAGTDGQTGTPDDILVSEANVSYNDQAKTAVLALSSPLAIGAYRAMITAMVTDLAGNAMSSDYSWTFTVKAEKYWISDSSGFWDDASKWSEGVVPSTGDLVVIDRPNADITVTYRSGTRTVVRVRSEERFVITGGTLTVEGSASFNDAFVLSGGTFNASGLVTLPNLTQTNGTLGGTGTIAAGALTWSGGTIRAKALIVSGATDVSGATFKSILGPTTITFGFSTVWADGVPVTWSGSGGPVVVNNPEGALWELRGTASLSPVPFNSGSATIVNAGTIRKTQPGTSSLLAAVNNAGNVDVSSGTLAIGGGTSVGTFTGVAGTTLKFGNFGVTTLAAPSQVTTAGAVEFAGTTTVAGTFSPAAVVFALNSGTVTFSGTIGSLGLTLTIPSGSDVVFNVAPLEPLKAVNINNGSVTFNNATALSPLATVTVNGTSGSVTFNATPTTIGSLVLSGSSVNALRGTGSVTTGSLTWTGGTIRVAALTVTGSSVVSTGFKSLSGPASLTLGTSTVWAENVAVSFTSANISISNPAGAVWDFQGAASFTRQSNNLAGEIVNAGTIRKYGAGTATIALTLTNSGEIDVQEGTLVFNPGVGQTYDGSFTGAQGTSLIFGFGGTLAPTSHVNTVGTTGLTSVTVAGTFSAGNVIIDPLKTDRFGTTRFTGTVSSLGPAFTVPVDHSVVFEAGSLDVIGLLETVTVNGWVTFNNTTPTTIGSLVLTGPVDYNGTSSNRLDGTGTVTTGSFTWTGGVIGVAALTVTGTSVVSTGAKILKGSTTLTLGASTVWADNVAVIYLGTTAINNPVGAVWDFQGAASFTLQSFSSGGLTLANAGTIRKYGAGTATLATLTNSGTVDVLGGMLAVASGGTSSGSFTGAAGTTLRFGSAASTLSASSQVNTAGTVEFFSTTTSVAGSFSAGAVLFTGGGTTTFSGTIGSLGPMLTIPSGPSVVFNVATLGPLETVTVNGSVTFNNAAPTTMASLVLSGSVLGTGTVTTGSLTWTGGTIRVAALTVTGASVVSTGTKFLTGPATLTLGPSTTWADNVAVTYTGATTINNPVGAVWDFQGAASFALQGFTSGGLTLANAGTIRKSGAGTATLATLTNSGTVEVGGGVLSVGIGTSTGMFSGVTGTTLRFGTHVLSASSQVNSAGTVEFTGSSLLHGSANVSMLSLVSGNGSLGGIGTILAGDLVWSAFTRVEVAALTVSGNTMVTALGGSLRNTTLTLGASTTWTSNISWNGTVTIANPAGANWELQNTASTNPFSSTGFPGGPVALTIMNAGLIRKTQTGTARIGRAPSTSGNIIFINDGSIDVQAGTLILGDLISGSVSSGSFTSGVGTTLAFAGTHTLTPTSQVAIAGTVDFSGTTTVGGRFDAAAVTNSGGATVFTGTVDAMGILTLSSGTATFNTTQPGIVTALDMRGGLLNGSAGLSTSTFAWTAGTVQTAMNISGVTGLSGASTKTLSGAALTLGNLTSWNGGTLQLSNGASITNPMGAIFDVDGSRTMSLGSGGTPTLNNAGSLRMVGQIGTLAISGVSFANTGTVALRLGGLVAGTQYDRVTVTGAVNLAGTLDVSLTNGFVPSSGNSFDLLTYNSRTGQFADVQGNGQTYAPTYAATKLTLTKP